MRDARSAGKSSNRLPLFGRFDPQPDAVHIRRLIYKGCLLACVTRTLTLDCDKRPKCHPGQERDGACHRSKRGVKRKHFVKLQERSVSPSASLRSPAGTHNNLVLLARNSASFIRCLSFSQTGTLAWNVYVVFAFLDGMLVKADQERCERPKPSCSDAGSHQTRSLRCPSLNFTECIPRGNPQNCELRRRPI